MSELRKLFIMRLFYLIPLFLILANSYTFYEYINDVEDVMDTLALEISTFQLDETRNTSNVLRSSEQELLVPISNSAVFGSKDIDMNMTNLRVPVNHNCTNYDLNVASYLADRFNTLYTRYFYNFTKWMYYGQVNGVQITWPSYKTNEYSFIFDPRERPWFSQSIANSRKYVIMIDRIYKDSRSKEKLVLAKNLAIKLLHTIPYGSRISLVINPFEVLLDDYLLENTTSVRNAYNSIVSITQHFETSVPNLIEFITDTIDHFKGSTTEFFMVLTTNKDIIPIYQSTTKFHNYATVSSCQHWTNCYGDYGNFLRHHEWDDYLNKWLDRRRLVVDTGKCIRSCQEIKETINNNNIHIYQIADETKHPAHFKNLMSLNNNGLVHFIYNDYNVESAIVATYNFYKKLKIDKSYTHFVTKQYDDSNNLGKVVTMTKGFVNSNGLISVIGIDFKYSDLINSAFDESSIEAVLRQYVPRQGMKIQANTASLRPQYQQYNTTLHNYLFVDPIDPVVPVDPVDPIDPEPEQSPKPGTSTFFTPMKILIIVAIAVIMVIMITFSVFLCVREGRCKTYPSQPFP